jgi:hypothetical protein
MSDEPLPQSEIILYQTEDGRTRLQVRLEGETVWLSLNQMADLFQRDKSVISRHIKNVFADGELSPEGTVAKSATVQTEGEKQVTREAITATVDELTRDRSAISLEAASREVYLLLKEGIKASVPETHSTPHP